MLSYVVNFTHQFFSFKLFPLRSSYCLGIFTLKKLGQKCLPHAKSLAHGFNFMWQLGFYANNCESIFLYVVLQEATTVSIFFFVLQRCKQLAISICKDYFLGVMQYVPKQQSNIFILMVARSNNNDKHIFYVVMQGKDQWQQYFEHRKTHGVARPWWPCNNHFFNILPIARMTAKIVFFQSSARSDNNDGWLQQRSARLQQATTNQIFMSYCGNKQPS